MSTPGHPSYGLHLNREEVNAMLKPDDDSATLVLEWLKSLGVVGVHDHQWVTAEVTVAQAEELLQTKYSVYLNPVNSNTIIRVIVQSPTYPDRPCRHGPAHHHVWHDATSINRRNR
jgi:tripeptidyl-peptidase-1